MKYKAEVVNTQGCVFDSAEFNSIKAAQKWASGRGKCKLIISKTNDIGDLHIFAEFNKR